jgi:hypothetical protein
VTPCLLHALIELACSLVAATWSNIRITPFYFSLTTDSGMTRESTLPGFLHLPAIFTPSHAQKQRVILSLKL